MITKLTPYFLFLISLSCFAQDYVLEGSFKDENKTPIAYVNVIIFTAKDSVLVNGTTTNEEGIFKIEGLNANIYDLKASFLGLNEFSKSLDLKSDVNLGTIILTEKTQELAGVTVIARRPTIRRLVDRLVFNVENSTLSENNVLEVLKHTPGVLVHDGRITIKNSEPTVYINDRKVHLSSNEIQQLLKGTSANNIKSVEVITNPPAKYEAEGGAVLNIVTSKNIIAGYNGSIFGNYKQGEEFPKFSVGTSHFFKTKKLNTYVNYNISPRKDYRHNNESINFIENNQINSNWKTDYKRTHESSNQNINANIDYNLDENDNIGLSTSILVSPRNNTKTAINALTEVFNPNNALDSLFNTQNRVVDKRSNLAFTLDYMHNFKKKGEKLSISGHHTNYDFLSDQNVDTDYFFANNVLIRNNRFQTISAQKIKLYTGQVDYELPIDSTAQFNAGAKVSSIDSKSDLDQFNFQNGQAVFDLQNSDTFLYDEKNYAAYVSYSKDWKAWSLKSGLRAEYTDIIGNSVSTNQINNNNYVKFFPSFYILNRLNDNNEIYFNYNKRIYRPRYSQLNPFKLFLNDNAYFTGDPNLKPQIDDMFTLGYTLNKKYTLEFYYRYEKNPTNYIKFQDNNDKILKYINTNIDHSISYGLDFTAFTEVVPQWNLSVYSSLFYYEEQFFALESNNELLANDKWSVYAEIVNYFSFLNDRSLRADITYLYISPVVDGPEEVSSRSGLDINIRKTLWNNRASINIGITDIFNDKNYTTTTKYLNQDVFLKSREENRLFTFGFNYKFGNFRLQPNKKEIDLNERDRLNN